MARQPSRGSSGFRLLTEPASLKQRRRRRGRQRAPQFPAPHRAGLIEALAFSRHFLRQTRKFPAPHRAGLIEALPCETPRVMASCFRLLTEPASLKPAGRVVCLPDGRVGFRLLTEPASLKRPRAPTRARPKTRPFPAPHRAGLIEALRRAAPPRKRTPRFRLLTEPASLKLLYTDNRNARSFSFRLLTEPASLKHRVLWTGKDRHGVSGSSQSRPH